MKKLSLLLLVVAFVLGAGIFAQAQTPAPSIPKLTVEEYKANPNKVFVVMFSVAGCKPCQAAKRELLPELVEIFSTGKYKGKVGVFTLYVTNGFPAGAPAEWSSGVGSFPAFRVLYNGASMFEHEGYSSNGKSLLKKEILDTVNSKM